MSKDRVGRGQEMFCQSNRFVAIEIHINKSSRRFSQQDSEIYEFVAEIGWQFVDRNSHVGPISQNRLLCAVCNRRNGITLRHKLLSKTENVSISFSGRSHLCLTSDQFFALHAAAFIYPLAQNFLIKTHLTFAQYDSRQQSSTRQFVNARRA